MGVLRWGAALAGFALAAAVCADTNSGDLAARQELKRAELSGARGMQVITS